jgi:hypothetical protein
MLSRQRSCYIIACRTQRYWEISSLKIMSIVGARPNFMKIAPFVRALRSHSVEHVLIHTVRKGARRPQTRLGRGRWRCKRHCGLFSDEHCKPDHVEHVKDILPQYWEIADRASLRVTTFESAACRGTLAPRLLCSEKSVLTVEPVLLPYHEGQRGAVTGCAGRSGNSQRVRPSRRTAAPHSVGIIASSAGA